jgi:aldose 1-epimerase
MSGGEGTARLVLEAPDARLEISPADGGRISSVVVRGSELLLTEGLGPMSWGAFPMAPFAGRIRHGAFRFDGRDIGLPLNHPPHAIHGTVFVRSWSVLDDRTIATDLGPDWPFAGRAVQRFDLTADGLEVRLTLEADERMPGAVGWHPWFRRRLVGTAAAPAPASDPVELRLEAGRMFVRDEEGIPTGELVPPIPGPWDDCFTGLRSAPRLTWPGALELTIESSCDFWVVYDRPAHAVCVEPQSSPPDFVTIDPVVVEPGRPLTATMRWEWRPVG